VNKSELNCIHEQFFEMTLLVTEAISGRVFRWHTIWYWKIFDIGHSIVSSLL